MSLREHFQVGDVIQMQGPSVPKDLETKWFRVTGFEKNGNVKLSKPYNDNACTQFYMPSPMLRNGRPA